MHGKRCVVTGATSGIGREIATELVRRGADVAIVGRNEAKLVATVAGIQAELPAAEVDTFRADLSLLAEVRKLSDELHAAYPAIDVLVNNAGINSFGPRTTAEGFDEMAATNYLAPFLLTNLVLDMLKAAAPSRVVVTGSEAHRHAGRVDLDKLAQPGDYNRFTSMIPYGNSKLLDILFTQELARRLEGTGVTANSFCPGVVDTGLVVENKLMDVGGSVLSKTPFVRTAEQGARMGVRLATDPGLADTTGEFFTSTPGLRFLPTIAPRRDTDLQRRLWERTADLTGVAG